MSGIEGGGTKKPEAPSNIIFHRFRDLNYIGSASQLIKLIPYKVGSIMRVIEPIIPTPQIDPELTPHRDMKRNYLIDQKLLDYDSIHALRQQLNTRTMHKNPNILNVIRECDMNRSEAVDNLHETNKLGLIFTDSEGRFVFLPEQSFLHTVLEVRSKDWSTRLEQLIASGVISNDIFNLIQLIHEVITTGESKPKKCDLGGREYNKIINNKNVIISTARNGMIVTMFGEDLKKSVR